MTHAHLVPGYKHRPTGNLANDKQIISIGLIVHLAVSNEPSLFEYFDHGSNGIESTLWLPKHEDGVNGNREQYRSVGREADANLKANSFYRGGRWLGFTSLETQGVNTDSHWTDWQISEIKRLYLWGHEEWGWKFRPCPGPFNSGMGYHTMWGAPAEWTPVSKTCPGRGRIDQFHEILVPWLRDMHKQSQDTTHITAKEGEQWTALANRADVSPLALYRANNPLERVEPGKRYELP